MCMFGKAIFSSIITRKCEIKEHTMKAKKKTIAHSLNGKSERFVWDLLCVFYMTTIVFRI